MLDVDYGSYPVSFRLPDLLVALALMINYSSSLPQALRLLVLLVDLH
jgi:hypothetical protein